MLRLPAVVFALVCLIFSLPAQAVLQRVYVSAISGNDANTATGCAASAPCRWFSTAVATVDAGGEVVAMDSGAYGTVTITKSVSIIGAPGVYAGITVFSGNGVTIATAYVNVVLRGITINGMGGDNGISMTNGASLTVERCAISNFPSGAGMDINTAATLALFDTLMAGNTYGALIRGGATASVSRSRFLSNSYGLMATNASLGSTTVSVSQSEASANSTSGFDVESTSGSARLDIRDSVASGNWNGFNVYASGGTTQGSIINSLVSGNSTGLYAHGSGAALVAGGNTVTRNSSFGFVQGGSAVLQSAGGNVVSGNGGNSSGTIGSATTM